MGCVYNLITKILTRRMVIVLNKVVEENQHVFVER